MIDEVGRPSERSARDAREAFLVSNRLRELFEKPIQGDFDVEHLKAVHAYIFQDMPEHRPGVIRGRTEGFWVKHRVLEGRSIVYDVHYAHHAIAAKLTKALQDFGGPDGIRGQPAEKIAFQLASLYGDLDHAHGFHEGNSRTLREFTRELALEHQPTRRNHPSDKDARQTKG